MTTDPRWEEARELFLDLADLPADRREPELLFLAARDPELAKRVEELLRHDRAEPAPGPTAPKRYGPYEVVRPIGHGGMGEVFVARRADGEYEREVAVKVLHGGAANEELVRRFLRERQTLARLDHEYVTDLLDGGTTESGEPYLVMEYVEGEPADRFAARLDVKERLELFVRIGRAVQHAHERGFVHHDLKPSNVLVRADGTPRLLDFGIARPDPETRVAGPDEAPLTRTGHRVFTPEYASPEQVRGEPATTRSDVFALGALLYVFLAGERPWSSSTTLHELERAICEDDPAPPSRLVTGTTRRRISGDLDAIVLQCLAKRPKRRYESVADLCDDVERHLDGRPIRARRTGTLARAVRFARRKPIYPVGGALLLTATFAAGWAWRSEVRGERGRERLVVAVRDRIEAARQRRTNGDLEAADQELDAALVALNELPGERALGAEILVHKAVVANLDREWKECLALLERAEAILDEQERPDPVLRAMLLNSRTLSLQRLRSPRSRDAALAAFEFARDRFPAGDTHRVDAILGWADEQRRAGKEREWIDSLTAAADELRTRDPKSEVLARTQNERAIAFASVGRHDEAIECYREALEILGWNHGERHSSFMKVRLNLGSAYLRADRYGEAFEEYERALTTSRALDEELFTAAILHLVARAHLEVGGDAHVLAAIDAAREALEIRRRNRLAVHTDRSRALLGIALARAGRLDEARGELTTVFAADPLDLLPEHEADARHLLGAILDDAGDPAATPHLRRALELKQELLGPEHDDCRDLEARLTD